MPLITGTATSFLDLFDTIRSEAVANGWVERQYVSNVSTILSSTLGDGRIIYVGIKNLRNIPNDLHGFSLQGYTGFVTGVDWGLQQGRINLTYLPFIPLWDAAMPFWLVITERVIRFVVKVNTVYVCGYLGFLNSFGLPTEFSYPITVGGSTTTITQSGLQLDHSNTTTEMQAFVIPDPNFNGISYDMSRGPLCIRDQAGVWRYIVNSRPLTPAPIIDNIWLGQGVFPYCEKANNQLSGWDRMKPALGDVYTLTRTELITNTERFGELDGCFHVPGFGVSSEDTFTIDGVDYLVVPNIFRTSEGNYWAFKLEE